MSIQQTLIAMACAAVAALFAWVFVALSDLSVTWLGLLSITLTFLCGSIWFRNIKDVLFFGLIFTSSINLSKALIVEGGVYTPGLSIILYDIFLLPLLAFWLVEKKVFLKKAIFWSKLHTLPLLFLLWMWVTVLIAHDKQAAILMCVNQTKYFVMFVLLADYITSSRHLKLFLYAFALGLCAHFMIALLETLAGGMVFVQGAKTTTTGTRLVFEGAGGVHAFRPSGLAGHPNALADMLVFFMPILLGLFVAGRSASNALIHLISIVLLAVCGVFLLLTLSRAGWISTTCASIFLIYLAYRSGALSPQVISTLAALAVAAVMVAVLVFPTIYLRITESDQRSGESRIAMMHQAALIIKRNPVVGVGVAGYNRAARNNIPEFFSNLSIYFQKDLLKGVVHNKYLLVMAETGIIGIVLFIAMLFRFCRIPWHIRYWPDRTYYFLTLGLVAGIFGQVVFYLFDHFYADSRIAVLYLYFGVLAAALKLRAQWAASESAETS